jgi:hypothetical protein
VTGQLYDGELDAFTSKIWFIEAPYSKTVQAVKDWRRTIQPSVTFEPVNGPLRSLLGGLEPWAANSWKQLIVATASRWTALFSQGADLYAFDVISVALGCRSVRTNYSSHVIRDGRVVRYRDTALWLTDGSRDDLGPLRVLRVIQATNQDRWVWELHGEPQPFEEPDLYGRRRIRDRFNLAALNRYCGALGIERASESFYGPRATLVTVDTSGWPTRP